MITSPVTNSLFENNLFTIVTYEPDDQGINDYVTWYHSRILAIDGPTIVFKTLDGKIHVRTGNFIADIE